MLTSLGVVSRQSDHNRVERRQYRGDAKHVAANHTLLYSWISDFEAYQAKHPGLCAKMIAKYDDAVGKYGYSLRHLRQVVPTLFLKDFLLDAAGERGGSSHGSSGGGTTTE